MEFENDTAIVVKRSARLPAKELRLSSSFKALVEAAETSGMNTPTSTLLGRASDIIGRSVEENGNFRAPCTSLETAEAAVGQLRSCLSLRRHSDNPVPSSAEFDAAQSAQQPAEHKGLHWKTELVTSSTADQRLQARELQARYIKLEADLKDSEATRAMLQKQLHRVQEATVQRRDDLECVQQLAFASEERAAAAEKKAEALSAEVWPAHIDRATRHSYCSLLFLLLFSHLTILVYTRQHHINAAFLQVQHMDKRLRTPEADSASQLAASKVRRQDSCKLSC